MSILKAKTKENLMDFDINDTNICDMFINQLQAAIFSGPV